MAEKGENWPSPVPIKLADTEEVSVVSLTDVTCVTELHRSLTATAAFRIVPMENCIPTGTSPDTGHCNTTAPGLPPGPPSVDVTGLVAFAMTALHCPVMQ